MKAFKTEKELVGYIHSSDNYFDKYTGMIIERPTGIIEYIAKSLPPHVVQNIATMNSAMKKNGKGKITAFLTRDKTSAKPQEKPFDKNVETTCWACGGPGLVRQMEKRGLGTYHRGCCE